RMTWLVFYGASRDDLHVHPAGNWMKSALGLLAAGTLTTWLLFGGLGNALAESLPYHHIEAEATLHMAEIILFAPATWLALSLIAVSLALFWFLGRGVALKENPAWLKGLSESSFGFEPVNTFISRGVNGLAEQLRFTQNGQMNWNILGIIGALLFVLAVLWWSGV
ncbi:MAG: hypothetical protein KJZ72_12505, partial [Anaerolineales bacterium]|nr:hypothetical protein [Anaerolineales bacterium]